MDRDPTTGRFAPGNSAATGHRRPHAARVARFRTALMDAITEEDLAEIARALVAAAKGGDVTAARLLLDRVLGPAEAIDLLQRVEALEELIGT